MKKRKKQWGIDHQWKFSIVDLNVLPENLYFPMNENGI